MGRIGLQIFPLKKTPDSLGVESNEKLISVKIAFKFSFLKAMLVWFRHQVVRLELLGLKEPFKNLKSITYDGPKVCITTILCYLKPFISPSKPIFILLKRLQRQVSKKIRLGNNLLAGFYP